MKKLHLLCNAHLDPVWLWRRDEGIAEAIATFRVAADFCERYEGFVFNHNEALLYEWVEEYEPDLFARIQRLVREGKWVIMGGWYLQPDCVMSSGESLFAQIELGRTYFQEKFGVAPTTAIGLDCFGHSRGLVQILEKSGYDSYLFCRPAHYFSGDFLWEGFDGSRVLAHGAGGSGGYGSLKGEALDKIKSYLAKHSADEIGLCLWGVGNHGGGPSRMDLEDINRFMGETEMEILHSTAEQYMADIDRTALPVVRESLCPSMVGCYTSMGRIKQANRRLENSIAATEKMMSYAEMNGAPCFDCAELKKAKKALAFCQFHDVLPGSSVKAVEDDSLRTFAYGEEIVDRLASKAFFRLCAGQASAREGEIPVMAFNPHPYPIEGEFEVEFLLQNQNWNEDEITLAEVFDENGNALPTQNEKPQCTFNLDWVKHVSFRATLAPASVSRFNCRLHVAKKEISPTLPDHADSICVENSRMKVAISRKTGLIERYEIDGVSLLLPSGMIEVYRDNEDPWGMQVESFAEREGTFSLMSDREANTFIGYPEERHPNVRIVEDGDVRMRVQVFFSYGRSVAVVEYTIPKAGDYIDVEIRILFNEANKMVKYHLASSVEGVPMGETAFGCQTLFDDERESVFHKWCGIQGKERSLYVLNRGTYAGSFTSSDIKLSLLRTPVFAAHPIYDRQIAPHDRSLDHIDMGERQFAFRITAEPYVARAAQVYNEPPRLLSFFPSGEGERRESAILLDAPDVLLSSLKKDSMGYTVRLFNSTDMPREAMLTLPALQKNLQLHFEKYEIKTLRISDEG